MLHSILKALSLHVEDETQLLGLSGMFTSCLVEWEKLDFTPVFPLYILILITVPIRHITTFKT